MMMSSNRPNTPGPVARFFFGRIFPLPFLLVGLGVMGMGVRDLRRASASESWPEAAGVVKESAVEWRSGSKGGGSYHARIRYEYVAAGVLRSGDRVGYGDFGTSGSSHAQEVVNRYPVGKSVRVRLMPEDPSVCVLEPGAHGAAYFLPVFGFVFAAAGAAMLVFLPGAMKKQAERAQSMSQEEAVTRDTPHVPDTGISESENFDGVALETGCPKLVPIILGVVALVQLLVVGGIAARGANPVFWIFLIADSVMLVSAAAFLRARIRVTVAGDAVRLFMGAGRIGFRREIGLGRGMRVTLAPRGVQKNGAPVRAIVVSNAQGESFHFGSLLAEPRKLAFAARLAGLLKVERDGVASKAPEANPFAG